METHLCVHIKVYVCVCICERVCVCMRVCVSKKGCWQDLGQVLYLRYGCFSSWAEKSRSVTTSESYLKCQPLGW